MIYVVKVKSHLIKYLADLYYYRQLWGAPKPQFLMK